MSSQDAWEQRYHSYQYSNDGPHNFQKGCTVRRDGEIRYGIILDRDALTAVVVWQGGDIETINQHDERITVCVAPERVQGVW